MYTQHLVEQVRRKGQRFQVRKDYIDAIGLDKGSASLPRNLDHKLRRVHANDPSLTGPRGQFCQAAPMAASDVEDLIAPIDAERIHFAQILAPGFAGHDEGYDPAQEAPSIPSVFGDELRAAHIPF